MPDVIRVALTNRSRNDCDVHMRPIRPLLLLILAWIAWTCASCTTSDPGGKTPNRPTTRPASPDIELPPAGLTGFVSLGDRKLELVDGAIYYDKPLSQLVVFALPGQLDDKQRKSLQEEGDFYDHRVTQRRTYAKLILTLASPIQADLRQNTLANYSVSINSPGRKPVVAKKFTSTLPLKNQGMKLIAGTLGRGKRVQGHFEAEHNWNLLQPEKEPIWQKWDIRFNLPFTIPIK